MSDIKLYHGDCLDILPTLPDNSIDMILTDLPYATLNKSSEGGKWDTMIPLGPMWEQFLRVTKRNAAIVLFAQGLFSAQLIMSQPKLYKYSLIWEKNNPTGHLNAYKMPMRCHEDILVFYRALPTYNPQMVKCEPHKRNHMRGNLEAPLANRCYGTYRNVPTKISDEKFPRSVLRFQKPHRKESFHPTEKPVDLCRWLVRTYTNSGGTVLDATMGSGTTGVACALEGRGFCGIEKEQRYFDIAKRRIDEALSGGHSTSFHNPATPPKISAPNPPRLIQPELF